MSTNSKKPKKKSFKIIRQIIEIYNQSKGLIMMKPAEWIHFWDGKGYEELVRIRNMLIELLRQYEDRSLSSPLWKSGWDEITSDKERYKLYLGYLTELTKLMFEKCDSVDVYQTINPKTENANPNSGIEFSLAPVYLISRINYGYVPSQNGWLPYYSECIICYDGNYLITTGYASEDYYKTRQWKTKKEEKTGSMDVDSLRIIVAAVSSQLSYVRSDFSGVCDASSIDIEQFDINGVIQKRFYGFGFDEPVATIAKLLPSLNS